MWGLGWIIKWIVPTDFCLCSDLIIKDFADEGKGGGRWGTEHFLREMSSHQLHPSPGCVRPRLLRGGDKVQSFVMEFSCTSAPPSAAAPSSRQARSLCKELTLFLRWIIPSTSDTSAFLVRLIKQIFPQLVMNLMCCDSHKQGNKENPPISADLRQSRPPSPSTSKNKMCLPKWQSWFPHTATCECREWRARFY